jgi:hypothetical protein
VELLRKHQRILESFPDLLADGVASVWKDARWALAHPAALVTVALLCTWFTCVYASAGELSQFRAPEASNVRSTPENASR